MGDRRVGRGWRVEGVVVDEERRRGEEGEMLQGGILESA